MSDVKRVTVQEIRGKLQAGEPVLLVCAYPRDAKFQEVALDGAIAFSEFERRKASLSKDTEIVFY